VNDGPDPGLAAERTTLAWRRNGVSIVAAGLAIARGIPIGQGMEGRPVLGLAVLALGLATFVVGARQAARRARHIGLGRPTAELADLWPVSVSTTLVAAAAAVMALLH
jgi:uncharacterized membrane protein YidH (DUF202 family)